MMYELYTVPRCDGCEEVKDFLNEKGISYSVWNLKISEGRKKFGKFYLDIERGLRKTNQHKTILPLLVQKDNDGGVEKYAQELDEIKAMFG